MPATSCFNLRFIILIGMLISVTGTIGAAPFSMDELSPHQIKLTEIEDGGGTTWGGARGTLANQPQRLIVKRLSVRKVVSVTLIPLTDGDDFKLELALNTWEESLKSCEAEDGDSCTIEFTTLDDVGFKVSGDEGGSWQLMLAASPELGLDEVLSTPLKSAKKSDANKLAGSLGGVMNDTSRSDSGLLKIIIGLLVVIAVLMAFFLFRKNRVLTGIIFLSLFLANSPELLAQGAIQLPPPGGISDVGMAGAVIENGNWGVERSENNREVSGKVNGKIGEGIGHFKTGVDVLKTLKTLSDSWSNLSACSQISNPAGSPRIPTFCEDNQNCQQCYTDARREFDHVRGVLEQLRVIYKCNKDYVDSAISFGDSVGGIHAVSGLAWQSTKADILSSFSTLQNSYDRKYTELITNLDKSMHAMNACEAEWGVPDWYDRFGFIYMEFIKEKYKRAG
jgi:hypothetical protein